MPYKHPDWFSPNIPLWTHLLQDLAGKPGLRLLEVGSFEGRSAVWMLENILTGEGSHLSCVDTFEGGEDHEGMDLDRLEATFYENIGPWADKVTILKGRSGEQLRRLPPYSAPGSGFDFIYIDGSHVAEDVLEDAVLVWPLLKVGGILAFDDYTWSGPGDVRLCPRLSIDAFLATRRPTHALVLHMGDQVFLQRTGRR
jgi:predicted O-methyltransferase YrrM